MDIYILIIAIRLLMRHPVQDVPAGILLLIMTLPLYR